MNVPPSDHLPPLTTYHQPIIQPSFGAAVYLSNECVFFTRASRLNNALHLALPSSSRPLDLFPHLLSLRHFIQSRLSLSLFQYRLCSSLGSSSDPVSEGVREQHLEIMPTHTKARSQLSPSILESAFG